MTLAVGRCESCTMVQLMEDIPRDRMFNQDYPYQASQSTFIREHFERYAKRLLDDELSEPDAFMLEIGCNDGVMLGAIAKAGVRHLGVEPSRGVAEKAVAAGVRVWHDFFEESTAAAIAKVEGPADVIYSANTVSHISYIDSVFRGVDRLLAEDGIFVIEDRYLGDIIDGNYFDQIYDEHRYIFSVRSVQELAARFGFELVDLERFAVHGGTIRYFIARSGARPASPDVARMITAERARGLTEPATLQRFAANVQRSCDDLVALLRDLAAKGQTVKGYGATSKSATVLNYCGIGPELLPCVCDFTPEKAGRLTPGMHIPVVPASTFGQPFPDYALLFAWNHAEEIMAKEREFRESGGRWILYVPEVHLV
jgi:methylation protein EvaC